MRNSKKAWLSGDVCYQTGLHLRSLINLIRHGRVTRGHQFRSIAIQFKEESTLIILKKDSPKGPQIAFLEAEGSLTAALWVMSQAIQAKRVPWKPDRWMATRIAKKSAQ